jgi:DNA-binding MarR family transcriptional regulator
VTITHHAQPTLLFADGSITMVLVAAILLALAFGLTLLVAARFRRAWHDLGDANRMAWAMVRPFAGRLRATESTNLELAVQIKVLAETQARIVSEVGKQKDQTKSLTGYVEEALRNDAKFAGHLMQVRAALMAAKKEPLRPSVTARPQSSALTIPVAETSVIARLTQTELQVLELLQEKGSLPAPEIGREINKSREHTARLMKSLFEQGYVDRETGRIPFRYRLTEKIRETMKSSRRAVPKVMESDASGSQTGS